MSKFFENLKSDIDNPTIVSTNLAKEVALGHTAGPFTNPPFANLQVLPIAIVPKKHSLLISKNGRIDRFLYRERRLFIAVHNN
jgi:hypothetical protein